MAVAKEASAMLSQPRLMHLYIASPWNLEGPHWHGTHGKPWARRTPPLGRISAAETRGKRGTLTAGAQLSGLTPLAAAGYGLEDWNSGNCRKKSERVRSSGVAGRAGPQGSWGGAPEQPTGGTAIAVWLPGTLPVGKEGFHRVNYCNPLLL